MHTLRKALTKESGGSGLRIMALRRASNILSKTCVAPALAARLRCGFSIVFVELKNAVFI